MRPLIRIALLATITLVIGYGVGLSHAKRHAPDCFVCETSIFDGSHGLAHEDCAQGEMKERRDDNSLRTAHRAEQLQRMEEGKPVRKMGWDSRP